VRLLFQTSLGSLQVMSSLGVQLSIQDHHVIKILSLELFSFHMNTFIASQVIMKHMLIM